MRVGIIARADRGGLAQISAEFVRHVDVAAALLVDLGEHGRGPADPDRIGPFVGRLFTARTGGGNRYGFPQSCDPFFAEIDVCVAVETWYDRRVPALCRQYGVPLILHAMPELLAEREVREADVVWLPTGWRHREIAARRAVYGYGPPELVSVPIAADRFSYRPRVRAETFFVHGGEAFHDRNGLDLVYAAAAHVDRPCELYVRGGPWPTVTEWDVGRVTVRWLPPCDRYADVIPRETDVMLMPRRYGGLSLPVAEAAVQGVATVMSNLEPQSTWISDDLLVRMDGNYPVEMKGGPIAVHTTDPAALAAVWNRLADSPDRVQRASDDARAWALTQTWDVWSSRYADVLERVAASRVRT